MEKIKYWEHYSESRNAHEANYARIVDSIPKVGDHVSFIYDDEVVTSVYPALMDCEQPTRDVWNYDFWTVEIQDAENEEDIDWVVLAIERDGWDRWECEPFRDDWDEEL